MTSTKVTLEYCLDKETKGSYRFAPKDPEVLGQAALYIRKDRCRALGIEPNKGFYVTIHEKASQGTE